MSDCTWDVVCWLVVAYIKEHFAEFQKLSCRSTSSDGPEGTCLPRCLPRKEILNHLPLKEFNDTGSKISFPVFVFYIFKMSKYQYCFSTHHIWAANLSSVILSLILDSVLCVRNREARVRSSQMTLGLLLNFLELFFFFFSSFLALLDCVRTPLETSV